MNTLAGLLGAQVWVRLLTNVVQSVVTAIPAALACEAGGWLLRWWVLRRLNPVFARDAGRDPVERARRRRMLRDGTVIGLRWFQNSLATVIILTLWGVQPLATVLFLALLAAVSQTLWRDAVATYRLLWDDVLGVGDQLAIDGGGRGIVSEIGWRRVKLVAADGQSLSLPAGEVRAVKLAGPGG
ncbi:MAG: mechanosensitive ion channel family protein [Fimbriimonadaceae bacterium]|nr:mechanosensitive ion channel family protein [Fimbriimonadaceae bacterium]